MDRADSHPVWTICGCHGLCSLGFLLHLSFVCFAGVRSFGKALRQREQTGAQTEVPPAGSGMLPPAGILIPRAVLENNEWLSELCLARAELSVSLGWFQVQRLGSAPFSHCFHWFGSQEGVLPTGQLWREKRQHLTQGKRILGRSRTCWELGAGTV